MDILAWYFVFALSLATLIKSLLSWISDGRLPIADIILGLCLFAACLYRAHQAMAGCSP